MSALDMTSFDAALKVHYTDDVIEKMTYKDHPFYALVPKYEKFGGKNLPIDLIYANTGGRSATFSNAQAQKLPGKYGQFVLTRNHDYSLASIDNETIEASMGDANAMLEAATSEIDLAMDAAGASAASACFRDGTGWIGQVASTPSNNASTFQITLLNSSDVTQFDLNQTIVVYSATSGGSQRSSDGSNVSFPIVGIDRDQGILTVTGTYSGSGTMVTNDYIFVSGDRGGKMKGLSAWIPYTAPTSTAFFGVDRTADTIRLAGCRKDISSVPMEEGLIDLAVRIGREGGRPDYCFMSFDKFGNLEKQLGSKVKYEDVEVGTIGFKSIAIQGPRGTIKVIADQDCPSQYTWMVSMNTWKLYSLGKTPKILSTDGNKMLRDSSSDSVEVRIGYYAQLGCRGPAWNGVGYLG